MRLSTDGIVLRSFRYEENRILTILTRKQGIVTAFANHANRPRSPLAATTELLCYSDFRLFKRKNEYVVDSADSNIIFFGLRSHFENFSLASYWAQLFAELSPREEEASDYVNLLLGCLHYLEKETRPARLLKAIAELRLLTLSGYMPDLIACSQCGVFEKTESYFFSLDGELFCEKCKKKVSFPLEYHPNPERCPMLYRLTPGVVAAMRHILYADARQIYAFSLSKDGEVLLSRAVEAYLLHQLGHTFPTLEFYRSLVTEPKNDS